MSASSFSLLSRALVAAAGLATLAAFGGVQIATPVPFPNEPDPQAMADGAKLPRLVKSVEPVMPAEGAALKHDLRVYVSFVVSSGGKVLKVSTMFEPPAAFAQAAVEAVRQWEFEPGMHYATGEQRMVSVYTQMTVQITFPAAAATP